MPGRASAPVPSTTSIFFRSAMQISPGERLREAHIYGLSPDIRKMVESQKEKPMTSLARFLILAVFASIVAACATVQPTEAIGPNDPAALAAIRAAYMKAGEQKSFRARMATESNGKLSESTIQFAAPASLHMVMKTDNMEHIVIGGAHYLKSDGKWT